MSIEFRHATLDNGLSVVAEVNPRAHSAAIGYYVKTGARDEPSPLMGVSHFLEHMIFKGTATRTAAEVDRDFDDLGAHHNAFTSSEMTAFYAHVLPEHLEAAQSILADIMRPALRAEDFDAEKKVILEEIAMYDDYPFFLLYEQALEAYFGSHRLSHRVLGTNDTITAMARDDMASYFQHHYSADNTSVVMAGRLDFDAMVERIGRECADWPRTGVGRTQDPFTLTPGEFALTSDRINAHYLLMLLPAPPVQNDRRYAASLQIGRAHV
jgi:predicted Zn-dependent peptidase